MNSALRRTLTAFLVYAVLAAILTVPTVPSLGRAIPGGGDAWFGVWIMDWFHRTIPPGPPAPNPITDFFYPQGFDYATGYDGILPITVGVALRVIFSNPLTAYALVVLLGFVTSALGMFSLAWNRTKRFLPALAAGFIFGFSPALLARGDGGHFNLLYAGVVPLAILATLRMLERRTFGRAVVVGASLTLAAASSFYYGMISGVSFVALVIFRLATERSFRNARMATCILTAVAVTSVLAAPLVYPALSRSLRGQTTVPPRTGAMVNAADAVSFFVPAEQSNLRQFLAAAAPPGGRRRLVANKTESANYLGTITLVLAFAAVVKGKDRDRWQWVLLAGTGIVMAMGPNVTVLGQITDLPLPYGILTAIPGFQDAWAPSRFTMLAHVGIGMLVALVLARWKPARWGMRASALVLGLAALLIVERVDIPFKVSPPPFDGAWIEQIRNDRNAKAIAILPAGLTLLGVPELDYLPVALGKPLTEGYIHHTAQTPQILARVDEGPLAAFSCHRLLETGALPEIPPAVRVTAALSAQGVGYVVLLRDAVGPCKESGARSLQLASEWPTVYTDAFLLIVAVPNPNSLSGNALQ